MSSIVGIDGHIAFSHYHQVEKVCKVLFCQTPIEYFCYQRFLADGSYTILASHTDLASYFFKDGAYLGSWMLNVPFNNFCSGLLLWDIARNFSTPEQIKVGEVIEQRIGLVHGIDIIEKFDNYCDAYCFASDDREIYHCSIAYLKKFSLYFQQECYDLIQQARNEKFYFPAPNNNKNTIPIIGANQTTVDHDEENSFEIKKFYLQGEYSDIYLTKKEVACLEQLSKGNTAKESALTLGVSYRTIEHHVEHIKSKLGCRQLSEVLLIAMKNNII